MSLPFSIPLTIAAYAAVWVLLHFGWGYLAHILPEGYLGAESPVGRLLRARTWEVGGRLYLRVGVRRWKKLLPEAGSLYSGGFSKRHLSSAAASHVERFQRETNRAELSHWLTLVSSATFFAWNPWWVGVAMVGYGLATNLPFIVVQRFNRPRLAALERQATERGRARTLRADCG